MMHDLAALLVSTSTRVLVPGLIVALASLTWLRHRPRAQAAAWSALCVVMLLLPALRLAGRSVTLALPDAPVGTTTTSGGPEGDPVPGASAITPRPWDHVHYDRPDPGRDRLIAFGWLAVAIPLALLFGGIGLWLRRSLGRSGEPHVRAMRIAGRLSPKRRVDIRVDARCRMPFTTGVLRPRILLPASSRFWSDETLEACVAHELSHVLHHDPLWNAISLLACTGFWFHPLAWIARRRVRRLLEDACDLEAARAVHGARRYARCLIEVAATRSDDGHRAASFRLLALPMAGGTTLARRVDRLLRGTLSEWPRSRWAFAVLVPLLATATLASAINVSRSPGIPLANSPTARPLLHDLASADAGRRAEALFKLARWKGREPEVMPILVRHLGDAAPIVTMPRWDFRRDNWGPARASLVTPSPGEVAALGLASMGAAAAPALASQLCGASAVVRRNAAWAIGELRHPRGLTRSDLRRLRALLEDPDATARAAAAWSLGDISDPASESALRHCAVSDPDAGVRREARTALRAVSAGVSLERLRHDG